jgi:non-ribosomal peptide synthetase component F
LKKLERGIPTLHLPADSTGLRTDTAAAAFCSWVDNDVKERLKRLAETNNTTLSTVMFSIYNILLSHISGQDEVVCSLIGAGRDHPGLLDIVGYFTNSAMVVTRIDPEEDFSHLLLRVHDDVMETVQHQSYPLEPVLDELRMSSPAVPVTFNMLNIPGISTDKALEGAEPADPVELPASVHMDKVQGAKFDLALLVTEHPGSIELLWNYRKSVFKPETVESVARLYMDLLDELSEDEEE